MATIDERANYNARTLLNDTQTFERSRTGDQFWNTMSWLVILCMGVVLVAFGMIFIDPSNSINPFPPPTTAPTLFIPTGTPTLTPSVTVAVTSTPTLTPEPEEPTATATISPTATLTPTEGPSATPTINSAWPFIQGNSSVISGEVFHSNEGCKLWVAGQALDMQGTPLVGITVQLGGYINAKSQYQLSLTGTALQYGPAGYEFTITDQAVASSEALWVQLLDQSGIPLSNRIYFDTYDDCQRNLILINFKKIR